MQTETLASHDDYLITLHRAGETPSKKLVITFGLLPSGKTPAGFGTSFLLKKGYDTIYVAQERGTQYQGLSQAAFFEAVADQCIDRDVVTYGSSLGGYAALYYGGCLDARIIAAAPMLPAWPPLEHPNFPDFRIAHEELWDASRSLKPPVAIYDMHLRFDCMMIDEMVLRAYPNARLVKLEHTGHIVLKAIQRAGQLTPFLLRLIEDDEIIPLDLPTEDCALWTFGRGKLLLKQDPEEARRLLERSFALEPTRFAYELLLNILLRKNLLAEARDLMKQSSERTGQTFDVNKGIARLIEEKGVSA